FTAATKNALKNTRILGPAEPMISKIRNEFLLSVAIKVARDRGQLAETKALLLHQAEQLKQKKEYRGVKVVFDVDPA
ncbi:MAG: hypothetical protein ACKOE6_16550, partial [Flammeovirgaceae bacterium]